MSKEKNTTVTIEKRVLSGGFANTLLFVFSFVQSIVLVPVFLGNWGKEKYGIWIALNAFFTLVKTIDLGHQNYVGNEILKYYHTNTKKAKEILASAIRIATLIGILEIAIAAVSLYFFSRLFWDIGRNQYPFSDAYFGTLALLLMWLIIGSVGGIWAKLLVVTGNFARATYWGLIFKVLETGILLYAAIVNTSILFACVLLAVVSLVYSFVLISDIKRTTPFFFNYKIYGNLKTGYRNFSKSIVLTISGFTEQFGNTIQIVFVTSYLGKGFVPVLTTIRTITNIAIQVITIFTGPVAVDVVRLYVQGEKAKIPELFSVIWLVTLFTIYLPFVIFTPFVEKIYLTWTHHLLPFDSRLFYLLALSVCVISFGTPFKLLLTGINHLRFTTSSAIIRFVILCAIPFGIKSFGLMMVGIAILCSEMVASAIVPFFYLKSLLGAFNNGNGKSLIFISTLPLMLLGLFFYILQLNNHYETNVILTITFLVIMTLVGVIHWRILKIETKKRIIGSVTSRFTKKSD